MECKICNIINGAVPAKKLYEDRVSFAVLSDEPATLGHIEVFSRQLAEFIEELPDEVVIQMYYVANASAAAVFEGLACQGTNLICNNGLAANSRHNHASIQVLPRKHDDGLNFQWQPKKLSDDEMNAVQGKIKEMAFYIGKREEREEPVMEEKKEEEKSAEQAKQNYLIKQFYRVP